jgi:P pilus assembly chaperone PapD
MRVLLRLSLAAAIAVALGHAPDAAAVSSYYASRCSSCHGSTPTTCTGCHKHGVSGLSGALGKTTYAPGETMTFTVSSGSRGGWWRAAVLDQANQVVKEVSVSTGTTATLTVPAPAAAGTYAWKVAWYGNEAGGSGGATWVADAGNPAHGYRTAAAPTFTVATAPAPAPKIAVSPTSLSFGDVTVGSSGSRTFTVSNTGTASLTGTVARAAGTSAEFAASPASFTVAAGQSQVVTVTYAPPSAASDAGSLAVTSNDANVSVAVSGAGVAAAPAPAPKIAVSPTALSFGNVTVGSTGTRTFTVSNTGTAALTGTIARAAGTSAEYAASPETFDVAPGGGQVVTVTYAPGSAAADAGALTIASNDAGSPTVNVTLSATGVEQPAPNIELAAGSVSFGTVAPGQSVTLGVDVRNTGTAPLEVAEVKRCTAPATSDEFTATPPGPFTVEAGASVSVTLTYAPADAGSDAGCFTLASNDAASPSVKLDVSGARVEELNGEPAPSPAGGCASGGAGSAGLVGLLALALVLARRTSLAPARRRPEVR